MPTVLDIRMDVDSLTLGEMMAVEDASGEDFAKLTSRTASRLRTLVFIHLLRTSGKPPDWQSLADLSLQDALPSSSDSSPDGASTA